MKPWIKILCVAGTFAATSAHAIPFNEVGDAGESLATAQSVGGGVNAIYGNLTYPSADIYSFNWGGGAFDVDTFGSSIDTQLFLFNSTGQGVWTNDNASVATPQSRIVDAALGAGQYFIGVSTFDYDPYGASGLIFPSAPFVGIFGPLNSAPLDHWALASAHQSNSGAYVINLNTPTAISEPPMFAIFGSVLLVFGLSVLRRSNNLNLRKTIRRD